MYIERIINIIKYLWNNFCIYCDNIGYKNFGIFFITLILPYIIIKKYIFDEEIPLYVYFILFGSIYLIIIDIFI